MNNLVVTRAGKDAESFHNLKENDWVYVAHPVTKEDEKIGISSESNNYLGAYGFISAVSNKNSSMSTLYFNREFREKFEVKGVRIPNWMLEPYSPITFGNEYKEFTIELMEHLRETTSSESIYMKAVGVLIQLGKTEYKDILVRTPK